MEKRWIEFALLFVVLPLILWLDISPWVKGMATLTGVLYVIKIGREESLFSRRSASWSELKAPYVWWRFGIFALGSTLFMYFYRSDLLFIVPRESPGLFVIILFVYTLLSVIPQEWLYRSFFYKRYYNLFPNLWVAVLVNGVVFSAAHLFLKSNIVLILTLIGGWLFYHTFRRSGSFLLVCAEHAAYGLWLFTIGAGEMLAFPMPG